MRLILTLVAVFIFGFKAIANNESPKVSEIKVLIVEMPVYLPTIFQSSISEEVNIAILYKMRENIIRRELSFVPKKKWMKWS